MIEDYVHSRHAIAYDQNETIAFHPQALDFPTFYSFTPEFYASFPNSQSGKVFLTFKGGMPFIHRELANQDCNVFFGVACDQVIEPVINELPDKVKRFLVMQQQSAIGYFADRIITSRGHLSHIPPGRLQKFTEGKYDVEFLRDINGVGGLYYGAQLYGNWMKVRLVRENSVNFIAGSVNPAKQILYNELDSIIFKFQLSEQSAYNTNN